MTSGEPVSLAERRARPATRGDAATAAPDLLGTVAALLTRSTPLAEALREVAATSLEVTGGTCAAVLVTEDRLVRPAVALGTGPLAALPVVGIAEARHLLTATGTVPAEHAPFLPEAWRATLVAERALVAPLRVGEASYGVLAVGFADRVPEHPARLDLLETLASFAGVAARAARLVNARDRHSRVAAATLAAARTLASATEAAVVARAVADACAAVPGVTSCAVGVREAARTTLVEHGVAGLLDATPEPLGSVLERSWPPARRPVVVGRGAHLAFPLVAGGTVHGAVVVGLPEGRALGADDVAAAEAVAALGAAALDRMEQERRLRRQARRVDVLGRLGAAVDGAEGDALLRRLNDLLADAGEELLSIGPRRRGPAAEAPDVFPMRAGRRVVGELVAVPARRDEEATAFLAAVAAGVGEATERAAARAVLADAARERSESDERERLAAELHDSVGELFVGIGMLARRAADELPADSPWAQRFGRLADLGRQGKWAVDDSVRALRCVPMRRRGLVEALRALGRSVGSDSGIDVAVRVEGRRRRLPVLTEHALFLVANQALANAWRHARCTCVDVAVDYGQDTVRLLVRDDGVGLAQRGAEVVSGTGPTALRRMVVGVGGTLRMANEAPHGVLVEARVPGGTR